MQVVMNIEEDLRVVARKNSRSLPENFFLEFSRKKFPQMQKCAIYTWFYLKTVFRKLGRPMKTRES